MAASTLDGIMDGIATLLGNLSGLKVNEDLTDANMPVALIGLPPIQAYHEVAGQAFIELEPTITIFISKQIDQVGLRKLASYADFVGAGTVLATIEADRTLGGNVEDCIVSDFRPLNSNEVDRYGFVGGVWTLRCAARGK